MRLLVLGGTGFVGRALIDEAMNGGHDVTVLNRGTRAAQPGVVQLVGDRRTPEGLAPLRTGEWDLVVDTWSWEPIAVQRSAELLEHRVGGYAYVSTRSVYRDPLPAGSDETADVVAADPAAETFDDYATTKRGAEIAVLDAFGQRSLIARAGLILGPYEDIGRLPWWLTRIARGGEVLAPGPPGLPLQFVDARDLASFLLESRARGIVDVVSEPGHATMGSLLDACVRVTGSDARLRWIDPAAIENAGIRHWMDLPIWLPPGPDHDAMHASDVSLAIASRLRCRPVEDTVRDTWRWLESIGGIAPQRPDRPRVGLDPDVETRVLAALPD